MYKQHQLCGKVPATLARRYGQLGKAPDWRLGNAPQHAEHAECPRDPPSVPCIPDRHPDVHSKIGKKLDALRAKYATGEQL